MKSEFGEVPAICREVGLTCQRCTEDSARSLATVCKGLRAKAITQLFFQIYPVAACSSMSSHFARAYKAASVESAELANEIALRKPEVPATPARLELVKPDFERREVSSYRRRSLAAAG